MATCPSCINATLDYLGEEEAELPDFETWEKMVHQKVDVYRCPACGHVERVLRDPPKLKEPFGPINSKQIITVTLIIVWVILIFADVRLPSIWQSLCSGIVFIMLVVWIILTSAWDLFSTLRTKLITAKSRRAREKKKRGIKRAPTLPTPVAGHAPVAPAQLAPAILGTQLDSDGALSAYCQEPGQAGRSLTVIEGVRLDLNSSQLEWEERRTVKTCPKCKSARLIDMSQEDGDPGDGKHHMDPTQPRFYRCPSCHYIVRENPRALSKATQWRLVKVFAVVGLIEIVVEEIESDAASFMIYAIIMVVSLFIAYLRGDSE